jgi:hypothetical protein
MTRGKRLACPHVTVLRADPPKYATREEAWAVVGRIVARILAQAILQDQAEQEQATRKRKPSG